MWTSADLTRCVATPQFNFFGFIENVSFDYVVTRGGAQFILALIRMQLVCEYSRPSGFMGEPASTCLQDRKQRPFGHRRKWPTRNDEVKMDSLRNPIVRTQHACRFGCTLVRGVGMERSEKWHAATGFLYLYTHNFLRNKLERFWSAGVSWGPSNVCYSKATSVQTLFNGTGERKNSALQPHLQQRTSLANSTRHSRF